MLLTAVENIAKILAESKLTDTEAKLIDFFYLDDGKHPTFTAFRLLHPEHEGRTTITLKKEIQAALSKLRVRMWANGISTVSDALDIASAPSGRRSGASMTGSN